MNFIYVTANYLHWVTDASNFNTTDLKIKIKEEFEKLNFIKFGPGILTSLFTNMYTAFLWGIIRYLSLVCLQSCRNLQYTSVVSKDMLVSVTTSLMIRWLPIKDETSEKILKNLYCLFPYINDSMLLDCLFASESSNVKSCKSSLQSRPFGLPCMFLFHCYCVCTVI